MLLQLTSSSYCLATGGGPEKLVVLMEGEALLNDASGERSCADQMGGM